MALDEKIQKKAEGFGKLAPVFLEGAKFALENQFINVKDDLPCNHKELIRKNGLSTKRVIVIEDDGYFLDRMVFSNNEWDWTYATIPSHWMPIPKPPKDKIKL